MGGCCCIFFKIQILRFLKDCVLLSRASYLLCIAASLQPVEGLLRYRLSSGTCWQLVKSSGRTGSSTTVESIFSSRLLSSLVVPPETSGCCLRRRQRRRFLCRFYWTQQLGNWYWNKTIRCYNLESQELWNLCIHSIHLLLLTANLPGKIGRHNILKGCFHHQIIQ